jgi:hypothetical protein
VKDQRTRPEGGGNGSQSKFLIGTWPISQIKPDTPLFYLGQDRTTIAKLSALGTGLGTVAETQNGASENTCEIDDNNQIKNQSVSSQVFHRTPGRRVRETTVGERFKPRTLSLLIRQRKKHTGDHLQRFTLQRLIQTQDQISGS